MLITMTVSSNDTVIAGVLLFTLNLQFYSVTPVLLRLELALEPLQRPVQKLDAFGVMPARGTLGPVAPQAYSISYSKTHDSRPSHVGKRS